MSKRHRLHNILVKSLVLVYNTRSASNHLTNALAYAGSLSSCENTWWLTLRPNKLSLNVFYRSLNFWLVLSQLHHYVLIFLQTRTTQCFRLIVKWLFELRLQDWFLPLWSFFSKSMSLLSFRFQSILIFVPIYFLILLRLLLNCRLILVLRFSQEFAIDLIARFPLVWPFILSLTWFHNKLLLT